MVDKNLIRGALLGIVIASLLPALFPDIRVLLLARFLQDLTIGGTALVARAIFSDVLPQKN